MTNEVTNAVAEVRRTPVVADYLELLAKQDETECMNYLVSCFGDPTSNNLDKEGFEAFSVQVAEAQAAQIDKQAAESVEVEAEDSAVEAKDEAESN